MTIRLRTLTPDDAALFPEAVYLLNRTQGEDLFAPDYLDKRTADPGSLVVGAFDADALVGLGIAQTIRDLSFHLPFDPGLAAEFAGQTVGSFSTLAVTESRQGQGVGQAISALRLDWLRRADVPAVLGVSWVSGLAHTSDRVFAKLGFRAVSRIEGFFREMSEKSPFRCPGCRAHPCTCAAVLYRLDLR